MGESSESYTFRVTNKFIAMAVTAAIALVSAYPVAYKLSAPAPIVLDRYTGTQGAEHEERTEYLEGKVEQLERTIQDVLNTRTMALGRISKIEITLHNRNERFLEHEKWGRTRVREFAVSDARTSVKLDECLKRTGVIK